MAEDVSTRLMAQRRHSRRFGLTVGTAFLVFAGIALWRDHAAVARVLGSLGGVLIVTGLLVPRALIPVERGWMAMARVISRVTTPIVLGIFFFLILTPIGVIRRALGKHTLRAPEPGASLWRVRAEGSQRGDLTRQF